MVETAGTKLQRARKLRQLSIEDASRATKIRPRQIADLEGDDYSNFANLAYARSFLIAYGKYLKVDTRPYMEAFSDASTFGLDDYQYLSEEPLGVYRATRRSSRQRRPKRNQIILAGATVGLLAITLFGRLAYTTFERLGDVEKVNARREARARAGHDGQAAVADAPDAAPADGTAVPARNDVPAAIPVSTTPVPDRPALPATPVDLPALAVVAPVAPAPGPAVPLPGDGGAVRELLSVPTAPKSALDQTAVNRDPLPRRSPMFPADEPQPQKVVNNGANGPVN